jgi:hypothetical protein
MTKEVEKKKWAANIAFVGDKDEVKSYIKILEEKEEQGKIEDLTLIEGPYDNLQKMIKDRKKNLGLISQQKDLVAPEINDHEDALVDENDNHEDAWEDDDWDDEEDILEDDDYYNEEK